jgi:DNA-binding transcriptional LysR family regulator
MYAVWHRSRHDDPAHAWIRAQLQEVADEIIGAVRE